MCINITEIGVNETELLEHYDIVWEGEAEVEDGLPVVEMNETLNFAVSSGLNFPYTTSQHDVKDNENFVLVRYRYAGRSAPQRDFCKLMMSEKKVYRKEDILQMGYQPVNPGFGPNGDDTYSIWLYKGGANCKHFWSRVVYLRKGYDVKSIKRIGIANTNIQLPFIESEVGIRPYDMPNRGYLMEKNNNLEMEKPIYVVDVDELSLEKGMQFISLVDTPAMELDWIALNQSEFMLFNADVDKQLLYGVFIVADKKIYRKSIDGYIVFTKENIEKLVKKWSKNGYNKNVNFQHSDKMVDAFVREYWLVEDSSTDKISKYVPNVPIGSLAGVIQVEDENFWRDYIKSGVLKGFSIEVMPDKLIKMEKEVEITENIIKDNLYQILFKEEGSVDDIYNKVKKLFNV